MWKGSGLPDRSVAGSVGVDRGYRGAEGEGEGEVRGWRARL